MIFATESSSVAHLSRFLGAARTCRFIALLLLITYLGLQPVRAQVSASITGVISDSTGSAVASARVVAHNTETDLERLTTTDSQGHYEFSGLPIGTYYVDATKANFEIGRASCRERV